MKKLLVSICIIFNSAFVFAQVNVAAAEAKDHIDQVITVCDRIVDAKYLESSMTKPTLLNVGGAYPNHLLTIVINYEDRKNFPFNPEEFYLNKQVCVTGKVTDFKGKPQIIVLTPAEIKIDASPAGANERLSAGTTNRTASTKPTSTTNLPQNSNSQTDTTNPVTSTNRGTVTNPTTSGNQTSTTNPVTSTNGGTATTPNTSGNQTSTTNPVTSTNGGTATTPTTSGNQTSTTNPVTSTNRTNTTSNTGNTNRSVADNKISSAYSIEVGPNLRVRSGPGENFGVIEVTKAGSEVTILGSENGWSHVTYERDSPEQGETVTVDGYIKNSILSSTTKPTATNTSGTTTTENNTPKKINSADATKTTNDANNKTTVSNKKSDAYSIKVSSSLKVRSAPEDSADVMEVIKPGTLVSVIRSANGWSYVSFLSASTSGYVKSQPKKGYIKNSVLK